MLQRERECLRYAVYRASGLTLTGARKHFGMENMAQRSSRVEDCIREVEKISEACEELAQLRLKAATDSSSDKEVYEKPSSTDSCNYLADDRVEASLQQLKYSSFNWFEFLQREEFDGDETFLDEFYKKLVPLLSAEEMRQVDGS